MTQSIPIGMSVTLDQNVTYALPAKPVYVNSSAAVQTSLDGTTWNAYTAGSVASAPFIRSQLAGTVVNLTDAGKPAGSGTVSGSGSFQNFIAVGANPAQSGALRLTNDQAVNWRTAAGTGDIVPGIKINVSNRLETGTAWETLDSRNYISVSPNAASAAQSGAIRLANNAAINARNNSNNADNHLISCNPSNEIVVGLAGLWNTLAGIIKMKEQGGAVPAANEMAMWIQDNGAGKTQLMVQFNTGGPIQLAIQP